jgi:hypothetical protein
MPNKYSVLSIDETNDIEDNNNHKKGVEVPKTPISPKQILKRPEKMAENSKSTEKRTRKMKELQVVPHPQGGKKSIRQNWMNMVDP